MAETPMHDWLAPRLQALVAEGTAHGFNRDAVVAVIADMITGPRFNEPPPLSEPVPSGAPVAVSGTLAPDYSAPSIGAVGDWFNPQT
jgi:hypothetical protein